MSYSVTIVGMESTGVYWKPVYTLLETELGFGEQRNGKGS
jgi:hypothetical protein